MAAATSTRFRTRRSLGWVAAVLMAAAVACAGLALALAAGEDRSADGFTEARLATLPSTVPPRPAPTPPPASTPGVSRAAAAASDAPAPSVPRPPARPAPRLTPAPAPPPPVAPPTTLPLSPLNALVGPAVSAQPVPPRADVAPTAIGIEAIGLAPVPVRAVGVAPDGQLEVPDETEVGWYRLGAAPGEPGATVLAAHVSWRDRPGPFLELGRLEPGAFVDLALADGSSRRYQVVSRDQYGKLMLPREEIWRTEGPETLVLITCGGAFNPELRRYADNIVVTAVPVA